MSTIVYAEPELIIALHKKVIFVNPNDLQIFKELLLPEDLKKCGLQLAKEAPDEADNAENTEQKKNVKSQPELTQIQNVCISPSRQLLAITTSGEKALLIYQCYPVHAKLISVRSLARASSALVFSNDSKSVLVTDKTGDCYQYDCVDYEATPKLLLGHLSIVYDIIWTPDEQYIITCDRDDKIRITNYPATYDIHGYCLGHKEFVAAMAWLEEQVVISVSGDKTMRLWNYHSGKQLQIIELPAPGLRLTLRSLDEHKYMAAVLLYQPDECIGLYDIARNANDEWIITENTIHSIPDMQVHNLCFAKERLYVSGIVDGHFAFRTVPIAKASAPPDNWLEMIDEQFREQCWKPEDISVWFKKRYDNISEYLERKKRRIEEKHK